MYKTGDNNMAFTTVEQKIAWEYLEAYLRYSDFIKTAYFKNSEHSPAIEIFEEVKFVANHCEDV